MINRLEKFKNGSTKEKWDIIKKPTVFLIGLFLFLKFYPFFLPPKIIISFPDDKSIEVPLNTKIEVIFDRGVIKTLAERSFQIYPKIKGSFSWEGDQKLIFTPKSSLAKSTKYQINFKGIVLSKFFVPLLGKKTIVFETAGNPKIILTSPSTDVIEDFTPITVVFDRSMVTLTTINNQSISKPILTINPKIEGEGRWLGTTVYQFRPKERYKKATTYQVIVAAGLASQDGGVLKKEYRWEFSSQRPQVIDVSPKINENYVSPNASISATFNQNINPKSVLNKFNVFDKYHNQISGKILVSDNIVSFYPDRPLKREMEYIAMISQGVEGVEGINGMTNNYSWSFKTAAAPLILKTIPGNGNKNVTEEYSIQVFFKTPMDEKSFEENIIVDPQPTVKPSFYFLSDNFQNVLYINTYLARSTEYKITIGGQVKDQQGFPLGQPYTFSFKTAAYKPSVSIFPSGTYFAAFNQEVIPRVVVNVINSDKVDYSLYKLKREDLLELYRRRYGDQCSSNQSCRNWQDYNPNKLEKVHSWSERFEASFNTPVQVVTKVTTGRGEKIPPGFYFLDVHIPQGSHDNMVMIVSKSTLTVKRSNKQIFSWVVNQSTGEIIFDMKMQLVDVFGNILTEGKSNKDGVFMKEVDLFQKKDLLIFGEKDDDVVVAASAWNQGINPYDFGLPYYYNPKESKNYEKREKYKIYLILDRPIYRPSQKIYFKGVIKKDNDGIYENLQSGEKILVTINDARNRVIYSERLPISSFGSFSGEFILSKDANLGYYQISSSFEGNSYSQEFQVEEYKKPDLSLVVSPSKSDYLQKDKVNISINASYYFGQPVVGAPVNWVLKTEDYFFHWDKDWSFEFGDSESSWRRWLSTYSDRQFLVKKITQGKGKTNERGDFEINLPIDLKEYQSSQKMVIEASVDDISNQSTANSQEFIVHKSRFYVGLKPVSYVNQSGKEAKVEIVVVDWQGNKMSNIPVSIDFYKRTWETVREKNPDDGLFYYTSKPSDSQITSTLAKTDSFGRAYVSFTPTEGGTYKIVGRVVDENGNENISASFLWVSGSGFSTVRENNDRIILVTDKKDYLVDEKASVFIASPFASDSAKTLLTVERNEVLDYKIVDTNDQSNNFILPISSKYSPNVFISAVLIRGGREIKKPAEFKIGYTEIKVTNKKHKIDVKIKTDKKRYKPKEVVKATIETSDFFGEPVASELAVGLVDKAVWDLSNVEFSDIYKTFYQPRNLEVFTSQLLTLSMDRINANTNLGAKGGSGGGCFVGETSVLMKGGVYKKIKDIKVGDMVLTRESDSSPKLVEAKVVKTYKHDYIDQYLIINGELRVTPNHRIYVNNRWMMAAEIEVGDYLINENNQPVEVFSLERVNGKFTVYNLEIEKYKTYFAGKIYVHNEKGGKETSRTKFPDTAYWNPSLKTDKNGRLDIQIPLPDNLTTWKLIAIANSQEAAFGSKTEELIVNRDILIRPFVPRFLSVGDRANLGAIIVNTSGKDEDLMVELEGEGLQINDDKVKNLTLPVGSQSKIIWQTLVNNTKSAKIRVIVKGVDKSIKDALEITLPVKSFSIPEVVATAGQVKNYVLEKVSLPKGIDISQGFFNISFSPILGVESVKAVSYFFNYPYHCTEQTTSKLLSAIFIHRIFESTKINNLGSVNLNQMTEIINEEIQRLNNYQHVDGGWGWFLEYNSDPFITAYAYSALKEAKKDKFSVADQVLKKAEEYLKNQLASKENNLSLDGRAYLMYVLKEDNSGIQSYANNLFDHRFELSLESRAYLAMVMKALSMNNQAKKIYQEVLSLGKKTATTLHWEESNKKNIFGSNTLTTAVILEMMSLYDKNNPLIIDVVRYLMSIKKDDHWMTTRETAGVIRSIYYYLIDKIKSNNINENYRFVFNGKLLKEGRFSKDELLKVEEYLLSIKDLNIGGKNNFQIIRSGQGNLYYNINLKYYLPFSEVQPLEQGFVIVREFIDEKNNVLSLNELNQGTEVWVRLIVVAPEERHFLVVEDFLPAGLEAVNESLKNVSILNKERPKLKDKANKFFYFDHKEYHDDKTVLFADHLPAGVYEFTYRVRATTPGRYHYPPAQVYEMYTPDISGHSKGDWLEIK